MKAERAIRPAFSKANPQLHAFPSAAAARSTKQLSFVANQEADCNRAGGRFQRAGSQLHVAITQSTRAACPPDSLGHTFLRDLAATAGFFILDGSLHLDLGDGSGTMRFERPD